MSHYLNKKNIIIIVVVCLLAVAVCAAAALMLSGGRDYDEVTVSGQGSQTAEVSGDLDVPGPQSGSISEDQAEIEIAAPEQMPENMDVIRFVKQGYELKNMLAVGSFSSVSELTVNQAVQYAFCYLYAGDGCLLDYKPEGTVYRQATETQIRESMVSLFGSCPFDVTGSQLYSSGNDCFEMWQPDYSRKIYASAVVSGADDGAYRIETTYFEDVQKTKSDGSAVITVKKGNDGGFYIASLE